MEAALAARLELARGGDPREIGRLLTLVTDDPAAAVRAAARLDDPPRATLLGVTGPPGVGKSCLTGALIAHLRGQGLRVAALCVDPSSPLTGGAVLGDRIRMQEHNRDAGVFIRSFGSRGALGGLAAAVPPACRLLEACGFDVVLVETVGVGQNEVAVAAALPTSLLVLSPATGDGIQAIKGGVIEIADLVAVNKADLPGADRVVQELRQALPPTAERPHVPVLKLVATTGEGVPELWAAVREHQPEPARRDLPLPPTPTRSMTTTRSGGAAAVPPFQVPDPAQRTLPRLLARQVARDPDRPFLRYQQEPFVSFGAFDARTNALARRLAELGVERGDRVTLVLPNSIAFVELWFAAAKLGAIEVPVNPELKGKLLAHVLSNSTAKVIVCDRERLPALAQTLGDATGCAAVVVQGGTAADARAAGIDGVRAIGLDELRGGGDERPLETPLHPSDPLAILYTSGTTGVAKGVLMPHNQFYVFAELFARNLGLTPDDSYYTPLPLFHGDAQLFGVYFPLVFGTCGTLDERFSASRYWERVRASGATATNMLGVMTHILYKRDPQPDDADNPLRVSQSLPMVPFREAFEERFGMTLVTAYGQTETSFVTYDTPDERREGSCGRAAPEFEVAVVDEHDVPVPAGAVGEIVVRSRDPWTMGLGYFRMPEQTLAAYRSLWWHSGDAGHLDEDGWLYFDGRIKDAIRRRGENVSAHELESIVDDHEAVLESAAIGIASELSEEDIMVVVAVRPGMALTPEQLIDFCAERMPRHMVPRYVELRDEPLPRTPSEKIAKEPLREAGVTAATWDREAAVSSR